MDFDPKNQSQPIKKDDQKSVVLGSSGNPDSSDAKLWLNPMFNNDKERIEQGQIGLEEKDQAHVCPECHKSFTSGKALGGHLSSAHRQTNKQNSLQKLKAKKSKGFKEQNHHQEGMDLLMKKNKYCIKKPIICSLCGKNFPSPKSLFGHMRCHPEREWRGMDAPMDTNNNILSSPSLSSYYMSDSMSQEVDNNDVDDQIVSETISRPKIDLMESLKAGWAVTARRGRRAIVASYDLSGSEDQEEEKLKDAVQDLMILANYGDSNSHKQRFEEPAEVRSSSSWTSKAEIEALNTIAESKKSEIEANPSTGYNKDICESKEPVQDVCPVSQKYQCSTCKKCFPTYQALGGHRSIHNKVKIHIYNAVDELCFTAADQDEDHESNNPITRVEEINESQGASSSKAVMNILHQCNICEKTFPTGQALGGHKRCHFSGPVEIPASQEASRTAGRTILDLDLNEPPAMEDEDGIVP